MRTRLRVITLSAAIAAVAIGASAATGQSPQSYPYCALDSSTGATSCYYSSRAQCGIRCIDNPSYQGPPNAMANAPRRRHAAPQR